MKLKYKNVVHIKKDDQRILIKFKKKPCLLIINYLIEQGFSYDCRLYNFVINNINLEQIYRKILKYLRE